MADPKDCLLVRFSPPGGGEDLTLPAPSDLRFDSEFPGGFKSLSCSLAFPAGTATPSALQPLSAVSVVDRRTGSIVWHGELTDPGLSVGRGGQQFSVTAEGAQLRADGWREVYGLVDRAQESWQAVGDFQGSSSSFSGDLSPDGDYGLDGYDDIINFGDDLSGDFGDGIDFGGDFGDLGSIDFSGPDYPDPAGYEGYLGYLQDPFTDVPGIQLPIPLGDTFGSDGSFWAGWVPGITTFGATARGAGTTGTLRFATPYAGSGGSVRRRRTEDRGIMQQPGFFASDSPFWTSPVFPADRIIPMFYINEIKFKFTLQHSGAKVLAWMWASEDLATSGYYFEATETALGLYRVEAGAATLLASSPFTVNVGQEYSMAVVPSPGVGEGPQQWTGYDPARGMVDGLCWAPSSAAISAGVGDGISNVLLIWTPDGDPSASLALGAGVVWANRETLGVQQYVLQDNRYWGIAMEGDGSLAIQDVDFTDIRVNNVLVE